MWTTRVVAGLLFLGITCGTAHGQLVLLDQFAPGLGTLVGCGFDASASRVWAYGDFDATLASYTTAGTADATITRPGEAADEADIDFATTGFTLGSTFVPAGTLLFINGETGPAEVYGVDPSTGAVLSTLVTAFGNNHVVGGAWHPRSIPRPGPAPPAPPPPPRPPPCCMIDPPPGDAPPKADGGAVGAMPCGTPGCMRGAPPDHPGSTWRVRGRSA